MRTRRHAGSYRYRTCCINSTARAIGDMVDRARSISYATLSRYTGASELQDVFRSYGWGPGRLGELRLKDDWAVSYYRSWYQGRKCVYVRHSAIEYIFTEERG